jgi:hypothetical protein
LLALLFAAQASARIDHHFAVIGKQASSHGTEDTFRFSDRLFATFDPADQVGRAQVHCRIRPEKLKCRGVIHLNGEVGGFGTILINGNLGPGDNTVNVVGGTDDFAGAAGQLAFPGSRLTFDLVR